jgi:pimeloyl-ACP methyl ester carboxylesterase
MSIAHDSPGTETPVILLHGYPFDPSMWRKQIDFLDGHGYHVAAPDLPGMGGDKANNEVTTMTDMARHVEGLMDALRIERAVICGLSMGGYVAFEFIHLFPERVRALVLAGTRAPADNEKEKAGRLQQVDQMLATGMSGIADASLTKLLAPRTLAEKPDIAVRVREMILRADPQGAAGAQRGMAARRDYSDTLSRINVPTLIIVGREDPIRPVADAQFMHDRIRNSRLEIIEDAAHMTNMEQPEVFNRSLHDFLKLLH